MKSSRYGRAARVFVTNEGSHVSTNCYLSSCFPFCFSFDLFSLVFIYFQEPLQSFISATHSFPRDPSKTHAILGIKTLALFVEKESRLPTPHDSRDFKLFEELALQYFVDPHINAQTPLRFDTGMLAKVVNSIKANLSPMVCTPPPFIKLQLTIFLLFSPLLLLALV